MSNRGAASAELLALHVLDSLFEGCQVIGFDWTYLYVNDTVAAQGQRTREELTGRTMMECYPGIDATPMFSVLRRCMAERTHDWFENEFTFSDGSKGWFDLRFVPVPEGVCILSLDVTQPKRTALRLAQSEQQLRHAQKMDAIGRLAGGIAHDFNNLLSVVLSYAQLLLEDLPAQDPMRGDVDEIRKSGERAAELVTQLLAFSRQQVLEAQILDLNTVLADMDRMVARILGEDIEVHRVPGAGLGNVKADQGQIEQVLLNLILNARDAMPAGGSLTIETQNVELDAEYAARHLGVQPGPHVMLAVSDTGTGMDAATQERIFEPFFTTKPMGKGTGLGLATVFGIVQQSGGCVWVYSELGKGTTFKVFLPRSDEPELPVRVSRRPASVRGNETILLVEDDAQVRAVTGSILERNGYRVLVARSGGEALLLLEQRRSDIDLLLTDVVMPHMSGRELAERLTTLRPGLKVLYMSGYTNDAMLHHGVFESTISLLQKPITPDRLLHKVREALDPG